MSAPESKSVASVLEKPGKSSRSSVSREQTPGFNFEGFLLEFADALNTTLDLDALLQRIAELVRRVINYEIFAILLLNERTQELRMRFQIGHSAEAERMRIKVGQGVTGRAVQERASVLLCTSSPLTQTFTQSSEPRQNVTRRFSGLLIVVRA